MKSFFIRSFLGCSSARRHPGSLRADRIVWRSCGAGANLADYRQRSIAFSDEDIFSFWHPAGGGKLARHMSFRK